MSELIYPPYPVPGFRDDVPEGDDEMIPSVEADGRVYARATRKWCHGGSRMLHPVVHLHIVNRMGDIYLQHRSADKDLLPLYWDTAVGGHITYGEGVMEALFREASEELGFFDFNPIHLQDYVFESERERELVHVFAAVGNFELAPDNLEVLEGRYWTVEEIQKAMGHNILTPNFESEYGRVKDTLESLL